MLKRIWKQWGQVVSILAAFGGVLGPTYAYLQSMIGEVRETSAELRARMEHLEEELINVSDEERRRDQGWLDTDEAWEAADGAQHQKLILDHEALMTILGRHTTLLEARTEDAREARLRLESIMETMRTGQLDTQFILGQVSERTLRLLPNPPRRN